MFEVKDPDGDSFNVEAPCRRMQDALARHVSKWEATSAGPDLGEASRCTWRAPTKCT